MALMATFPHPTLPPTTDGSTDRRAEALAGLSGTSPDLGDGDPVLQTARLALFRAFGGDDATTTAEDTSASLTTLDAIIAVGPSFSIHFATSCCADDAIIAAALPRAQTKTLAACCDIVKALSPPSLSALHT